MSTFQLKALALVLMVIDHIGYYFEGAPEILRWVGRLSFPLFLFCMVQGWRHTRNRPKYLLRLYGMSLVMSAVMYFAGAGYGNHNIFITMFWVGVLISAAELFQKDIGLGCAAYGLIAASQVVFALLRQLIPALRGRTATSFAASCPIPSPANTASCMSCSGLPCISCGKTAPGFVRRICCLP